MDTSIFVFLFYFIQSTVSKISIEKVDVPGSIRNGSVESILLDCDFKVYNDTGVVLKWFYNGEVDQIYQWIPDSSNDTGSPMGSLKDHINGGYKIVDENNSTTYRAVQIVNVTHLLTGSYTCKVTGDNDEKSETKNMTIYVPAADGLNLTIIEEDSMVVCSAYGVYPEPELKLYVADRNNSNKSLHHEVQEEVSDGFYNKTSKLVFSKENLTNSLEFVCSLTIPGTSYALVETKIYTIVTDEIYNDIIEEDNIYLLNLTDSAENAENLTQIVLQNLTSSNHSSLTSNQENSSLPIVPSYVLLFHTSLLLLFSTLTKY